MKPGRVFWGVFFVALGALLLLQRYLGFDFSLDGLWKYWPILLVIWGVAILVRNKQAGIVSAVVAGLALAVLLVGVMNLHWHDDRWDGASTLNEQEFTQPYREQVKRGTFVLESGAGVFTLGDTSAHMLTASTRSSVGAYEISDIQTPESDDITLKLEGGSRHWRMGRLQNKVDVRLNSAPLWDLRFDVGAAKLDVDLSPYKVDRIVMNSGASEVRIKLGMPVEETRLTIDAQASSVSILYPANAGCEVRVNTQLSRKNFRDMVKKGDGTYRTENFETSGKKIFVNVDAGVSSVSARSY